MSKLAQILGKNLKRIRTAAGLSQQALALKIGCTRQSIHMWESGQNFPDPNWLKALCEELRTSEAELVAPPAIPSIAPASPRGKLLSLILALPEEDVPGLLELVERMLIAGHNVRKVGGYEQE